MRSESMIARVRELRTGLALASVPLAATLLVGMLLFPRQGMPDALPLPVPDPQGLAQAKEADDALAVKGRRESLPGAVRALGSALRDFHTLELGAPQPNDLIKARRGIDAALIDAAVIGDEPLLELRAVQLDLFLVEVDRFSATGFESPELGALAGPFVRTMRGEGWCEGHRLVLTRPQLRAVFKQMWNTVLDVDDKPPYALALDEKRALFSLRLARPRLPGRTREGIVRAKQDAKDERACSAVEQYEQKSLEHWALDHIGRLAAIDPVYPADFARGVAALRGGDAAAAATYFHQWLSDHPDGALTLRARTYMRLAARASQTE